MNPPNSSGSLAIPAGSGTLDGMTDIDGRLLLGPLVRYVDCDRATFWVETDRACTVAVQTRADSGETRRVEEPTWGLHGHHYALVAVEGLPADSVVDYTVSIDGDQVWPAAGRRAVVHTQRSDGPITVAFGSCRRGDTYSEEALTRIGADALVGLADRVRDQESSLWPDLLVFLGDQVYADDPSPEIVDRLHARRAAGERVAGARSEEVEDEICDFEEYTWLYQESWGDLRVRELLATVPTCMILDDHDLRDDWNSSADWRAEVTRAPGGRTGSSAPSRRTGSTNTWAICPRRSSNRTRCTPRCGRRHRTPSGKNCSRSSRCGPTASRRRHGGATTVTWATPD